MVLMHTDRDIRIGFNGSLNEVLQEKFTRIAAGTGRSLHDDGGAYFLGSRHDGLNLFHVVDVESRNAVTVFSSVIQ